MLKYVGAFVLTVIAGELAVLVWNQHAEEQRQLPVVQAAQPVIIPWRLNTLCSVNSRNLPTRDPEIRT